MNDFFMGLLDEANPEQLFKLIEVMLESNQANLERDPSHPNQFSIQLATQQLVLKATKEDIVIDRTALISNDFIKRLAYYIPPVLATGSEESTEATPEKGWLVDTDLDSKSDRSHRVSSEEMLAYLIKTIQVGDVLPLKVD